MSPKVITSLANLTAHRNRELLDLALAEALMDVMTPERIVFVTAVTQGQEMRWLERAVFVKSQPVVLTDPMWADFEQMAPSETFPHRLICVKTSKVQHLSPDHGGTGLHVTLFPISGDGGVESVLEVHSQEPLGQHMLVVVHSMQMVYRNMQALLDYSERDSLTGLLNRKSFDDAFFKALRQEPVSGVPDRDGLHGSAKGQNRRHDAHAEGYWLGMLDIDHFKRVNDTCGHLIGDEVLLLVARLLRKSFRFHDRLYRFGGEEFVVLMRCPNAQAAHLVFDRFRQAMEAFLFPQVGIITVSIGISQLTHDDTPAQALDRADQAVYAAKAGGRNRIIDHADLVRQGHVSGNAKVGDIELF